MELIRKVAYGEIGAPPLARQDAHDALAVYDRIAHARDAWDGTIDDLAGYLRMMGSYITGYLQMREIVPEIRELTLKYTKMGGAAIFDVFLAGDPATGRGELYSSGSAAGDNRARRNLNSFDIAIRDVVTTCAMINIAMVMESSEDFVDKGVGLFRITVEKLQKFDDVELSRRELEASGIIDRSMTRDEQIIVMEDAKVAFLQQAVKDKLGVTRDELNLEDVLFYCEWRFGCANLGIDSKFPPRGAGEPLIEELGMTLLNIVIEQRPNYLPTLYDRAMHMASNPNLYTSRDIVYRTLPEYGRAFVLAGGGPPWAQLRIMWIIAQGVMAGGLRFSHDKDEYCYVDVPEDKDIEYFTEYQLVRQVGPLEELLERMRPWLGDNEEFQKIENDVEEWREKYVTGKEEFEPQNAVSISSVNTSYWSPGAKESYGAKICARCGFCPETLKMCAACRQVWYCNAACQKAGWKAHKKACIASRKNA